MEVIAVIPARGGSKGVEEKNLQRIGDDTPIGRAVRTCTLAKDVQEVFVTTDSDSIAEEARASGAKVIERPQELSSDESTSEAALIHALGEIDGPPKVVVFAQCTSPFTRSSDIQRGVEVVAKNAGDVAFSVVANKHFVWQEGDYTLEPVGHPLHYRPRRQEMTSQYMETGNFYVFRSDKFLAARYRFHGVVRPVVIEDHLSHEIDSPRDLILARLLEGVR